MEVQSSLQNYVSNIALHAYSNDSCLRIHCRDLLKCDDVYIRDSVYSMHVITFIV